MSKRILAGTVRLIGLGAVIAAFCASLAQAQTSVVGFESGTITLEEGESSAVRLSIAPQLSGASTVAVALSVSDDEADRRGP